MMRFRTLLYPFLYAMERIRQQEQINNSEPTALELLAANIPIGYKAFDTCCCPVDPQSPGRDLDSLWLMNSNGRPAYAATIIGSQGSDEIFVLYETEEHQRKLEPWVESMLPNTPYIKHVNNRKDIGIQ